MMRAAIIFAFSEITGFALRYLNILDFGVTCVVLGGCIAAFIVGNRGYPSKSLEELRGEQKRIESVPWPTGIAPPGARHAIPRGLGSDTPASSPPRGGSVIAGGGQSNTALLALMKAIEQEIDARMAVDERVEKSDETYDEPMACYPMEMRV